MRAKAHSWQGVGCNRSLQIPYRSFNSLLETHYFEFNRTCSMFCCSCIAKETIAKYDFSPDASGVDAVPCEAIDLITAGFRRHPPALLKCISGPACGRVLPLAAGGWQQYALPRRGATP